MRTATDGHQPRGPCTPERRAYEPPRLRLHGDLDVLTRGSPNDPPVDIFAGSIGGT